MLQCQAYTRHDGLTFELQPSVLSMAIVAQLLVNEALAILIATEHVLEHVVHLVRAHQQAAQCMKRKRVGL